jgi:hypothetical protein
MWRHPVSCVEIPGTRPRSIYACHSGSWQAGMPIRIPSGQVPSASPQEFLCKGASRWETWAMKLPKFSRPLTDDARLQGEADRRTVDACRVRRLSPQPRAQRVGCSGHTVRHVIHACNTWGVEGWAQRSHRPKTGQPGLDAPAGDRRPPLWPPSPRLCGKPPGCGHGAGRWRWATSRAARRACCVRQASAGPAHGGIPSGRGRNTGSHAPLRPPPANQGARSAAGTRGGPA